MVDSIGSRLATADRVTRVVAATPTAPARSTVTADAAPIAQAGSLAQQLAAAAPIDLDRVARLKLAIADGTYPILPGTIADNLIALRLKLTAEGN
ncbi:flagellar biosynthesis anti-sigma factor FlgM [Sphingomonas oligophenolica]|uniref:Negative regulator of flagellin synthesis n=1 Tax=Sphingomonas oligophenolica TaxID=301154 RepID=A0A502CS13_9SPHN|nr:flagellar biosynthesis anti-sigma factor FlgM [Sphingomonas oligophenolica]TPG15668.1 flagellar biosynthesis anti-sigma factor FlgM [Sphingomonas oligophenolica]